jgi:hypothetical protein
MLKVYVLIEDAGRIMFTRLTIEPVEAMAKGMGWKFSKRFGPVDTYVDSAGKYVGCIQVFACQ